MERRPHHLAAITGQRVPHTILCVDTESWPDTVTGRPDITRHRFRLGHWIQYGLWPDGRYHEVESMGFTDPAIYWDVVRALTHRDHTLWTFAHRASFDFTLLGLWHLLDRGSVTLACNPIAEDPPLVIDLECPHRLRIVDSLNYWRCSLKVLGQSIGVAKLPMPRPQDPEECWAQYCRRDTEIIGVALCRLLESVIRDRMGGLQVTAASQALSDFRANHYSHPIHIHNHPKALALERSGYYGGYVQCSRIGTYRGPVYQVDVNSLYPHVMMIGSYPSQLVSYHCGGRCLDRLQACDPHSVMARVRIVTTDIPVTVRHDGWLCQCLGEMWTVLCGDELAHALDRGLVVDCSELSVYHCEPLFQRYVQHWYSRRMQCRNNHDSAGELLAKTMLCGLYGKFGQERCRWVECDSCAHLGDYGYYYAAISGQAKHVMHRAIAGKVARREKAGETYNSSPAIAAFITSAGRHYMRHLMSIAGAGHYYYTDTDSLIVDQAGMDALDAAAVIHPTDIGRLKLIRDAEYLDMRGLKDYTIGRTVVRSGVQVGAWTIADNLWRQQCTQGLRRIIATGPTDTVDWEQRLISRPAGYGKGHVQPDGTVQPLVLWIGEGGNHDSADPELHLRQLRSSQARQGESL